MVEKQNKTSNRYYKIHLSAKQCNKYYISEIGIEIESSSENRLVDKLITNNCTICNLSAKKERGRGEKKRNEKVVVAV